MKNISKVFLFVLFLLGPTVLNAQNDALKALVKQQATEMGDATLAGEYGVLADYTHPNVLELVGGRDQLIAITEMALSGQEGMKIVSVDVGDEIVVSKQDTGYHALIPKTTIIEMFDMRIIANGYLFGFGDETGENWTYVEADQLGTANGAILFPDFSTDIEIPEGSKEMIDLETGGELGEGESMDQLIEEVKEELEKELEEQEAKELSKKEKRIKRKGK